MAVPIPDGDPELPHPDLPDDPVEEAEETPPVGDEDEDATVSTEGEVTNG